MSEQARSRMELCKGNTRHSNYGSHETIPNENIDGIITDHLLSVEGLRDFITSLKGLHLLESLKRKAVGTGL